ncbi:ATPase subunit of ABC transporter with duplicated ATPase domains [Actinomycetospora succinea]|uniref:ATPase subunit of ABC transporter with duplicated ATPase domains n=1 Tax=Actinomycetospora succinea TaxID=663603 RepID=A0A4R6UYR3_9PSEU|nr:ABC-F family ATP-binding cassette domain-containing protein [Actinomycetospora succinea]TDQ52654.1 ATPase subunit of ABC transporter with duplicated ATPase domains [Actinomycetospora succinea]
MSATLVARDLAAAHGARVLFSGLDLVVAPGDVIGLVGVNGAGKSTLLRLLAGLAAPDQGSVAVSPGTATVGHLPQETARVPGETVRGFVGRRTGVTAAAATLEAATTALAEGAPGGDDAYAVALERWLDLGGADLEERTAEVAADLGLDAALLDATMTSLSGGQAARANLASLLLARFDLFLLDEPTNDLDLAGLDRLERWVRELRAGTVLVSHDREFLARTVTSVLELDLAQQQVTQYGGGYEAYLAERETARRHAREAYEEYADKRSELTSRMQTQKQWVEKGVRNARKKATDNDKFIKHHHAATAEKQAAKIAQTERRLERMEVVEEPRKEWELRMSIAAAPRSGTVVATLDAATVHRGDFTLGPVTLQLDWADRVAITGANGAGKSTLLALLLGRLAPDEGRASLGSGVVVGEVDQARGLLTGSTALLDVFSREPELDRWPTAEIRTLLAKFGLGAEHVHRGADTLSPGERTRAALALLQARGVNLLVLDEPTNHLDLAAIEQLESALASFGGTLLLVSHDRRLLAGVSTTRAWHVDAGKVRELPV